MKKLLAVVLVELILVVLVAFSLAGCSTKKTETTETADSLRMDTIMADVPAPATLAFSMMPGFSVKNTVALTDSVNFILLSSMEDIAKNFVPDKTLSNEIVQPDFVINHIFGVVCMPRLNRTTITLHKVEVGETDINVYVNITSGEALKIATKPAQIFAIEKRDGFGTVQFYVNGKKDKAFFLTGLP